MVIIGSDIISNSKFVNHIKKRYPFIKIVYSRNGYFDSDFEKKNVIEKISQLKPEIIIIGMGTKYQDKFAGWCFGQLLELDDFLKCFPYLKSTEKLRQQDAIWKDICKELKWQYIPSI